MIGMLSPIEILFSVRREMIYRILEYNLPALIHREETRLIAPDEILNALKESSFYEGQIENAPCLLPREAEYAEPERPMHPVLQQRLREIGIERLYSHQAAAFDLASANKDVVVTTGTGSGKTLCYNLPVLHALLSEPAAKALYLFPTKALTQDQLGKLRELTPPGIEMQTYDGDTPRSERAAIRRKAHIILSNPDMLHTGILPNHASWTKFLKNLRFLVLDELHAYSGVFGSHVALVISRLLRLCAWHGNHPQIISCSASIRNPLELFRSLTGREAELVERDGSPRGVRMFVFWNPPSIGEGYRKSSIAETARLMSTLVRMGVRALVFSQSRIASELVLSYAKKELEEASPALSKVIESYRGGYTPQERRQIERRLFHGEIFALSTTNAMELGVDIGSLDAVVINGYPGSVSSLRQQGGRAGRGAKDGLAIFVARDDPLEQFLMRHPEIAWEGKAESVRIHPGNPYVLAPHLICAAHEKPISVSELDAFPPQSLDMLESLEKEGTLERRSGMWFFPRSESPAAEIGLRSSGREFTIFSNGKVLGSLEEWRAYHSAHEGAIYMHRGENYLVTNLDLRAGKVEVENVTADYYTQSLVTTSVYPEGQIRKKEFSGGGMIYLTLKVTNSVDGYLKKSLKTNEVISREALDLPPYSFRTLGLCFDVRCCDEEDQNWIYGVHALEHLLIALAPVVARCEPRDLGSAYYPFWLPTMSPAIFVFDSVPGGSGICEALYAESEDWLAHVKEQLMNCHCREGCPSCILSPRCPYSNQSLSKAFAQRIISAVVK